MRDRRHGATTGLSSRACACGGRTRAPGPGLQRTSIMARRKGNSDERTVTTTQYVIQGVDGDGPGGIRQGLSHPCRERACRAQPATPQGSRGESIYGLLLGGCLQDLRAGRAVYSIAIESTLGCCISRVWLTRALGYIHSFHHFHTSRSLRSFECI